MTPAPGTRLDRDSCARGFVRAAQYFANMLASADVLAESCELIRSIFAPDFACFSPPSCDGCGECGLPAPEREGLRRAVDQVVETGLMAMETFDGESAVTCVVLPVSVRGRAEGTLLVGYAGERALPPHALEALLGVAGLVGATLARQRDDRELLLLAEERAARAVAEETERRTRLLSEVSKALFASFDYEAALATVAGLLVPQLADGCAIELRDDDDPAALRQVAAVHADPARAGAIHEQARSHPEWATVAPMAARGGVLGAIALVSRSSFAPEDVALAEEIGRRAGTAIENARLYVQAQQAIGIRDQFLAVASHELKTPLTALMLVVTSVERSLERLPHAPAPMRTKIANLSRQSRRLADLVDSLLDVSCIQAGRLHISIADVDLCGVVREVAERHAQEAQRAGCALEVSADGAITGLWDQSRVDQVVSNLLSNAIKYGAGKPIRLAAESSGDTARLCVTDGGIGIAREDHERIFQRFERAVPSSSYAGVGLGLWIVREIVTRLGGSIRVESRPGEGARFTVELPLAQR